MSVLLRGLTLAGSVIARDCHGEIYPYLNRGDRAWSLDYHTDDGPFLFGEEEEKRHVHCYDWVERARKIGVEVQNFYPHEPLPVFPDGEYRLFVCLSSCYTPREWDGHLLRLLFSLCKPVDLNGKITPREVKQPRPRTR